VRNALIAAAIAWALAIPVAAHAASAPHAGWAARHLAVAVYAAGSLVCHQRPERSFHTATVQWPVCARCAGLYFGAAAAAGLLAAMNAARTRAARRSPRSCDRGDRSLRLPVRGIFPNVVTVRIMLATAALPTMASLTYGWLMGVTPSHAIRAASGALLGAAIAATILRAPANQVN
jgi:hypothetical protein